MLIDLNGEIDSNTIVVGNLSSSLSAMDISSRKKVNEERAELICTLYQMNLTVIYRTFPQTAISLTLFSITNGTFSRNR
jgi:hypothetical protein